MTKPEIKLMLALLTSQVAPADLNATGLAVLGIEKDATYQQVMDVCLDKLAEAIHACAHSTDPAQEAAV